LNSERSPKFSGADPSMFLTLIGMLVLIEDSVVDLF
jgi:hypothetical protein